jgi:hypothetical protein
VPSFRQAIDQAACTASAATTWSRQTATQTRYISLSKDATMRAKAISSPAAADATDSERSPAAVPEGTGEESCHGRGDHPEDDHEEQHLEWPTRETWRVGGTDVAGDQREWRGRWRTSMCTRCNDCCCDQHCCGCR